VSNSATDGHPSTSDLEQNEREEALFEGDPTDEVARELDPEATARREAALGQVRTFGDPALKTAARPVTEFDGALQSEVERMTEVMRNALGVGLAATQLGIMHRVLVFQAGRDAPPTALVNPEIEWRSEEEVTAEEGCLSLPGIVLDVERPLHARVRGVDPAGEPVLIEASGLEARVLQHEIDHLDGVLILERAPREQRRGAMKALREGGSFAPERPEEDDPAEALREGSGNGAAPAGA
jgi:peptide deformylase